MKYLVTKIGERTVVVESANSTVYTQRQMNFTVSEQQNSREAAYESVHWADRCVGSIETGSRHVKD